MRGFTFASRACRDMMAVMDDIKVATQDDPVNHPSHYTAGAIECIDAIEAALGHDGFVAFLRGQVIKYNWRCGLKDDAAQDAAKAVWYAERLHRTLAERGAA